MIPQIKSIAVYTGMVFIFLFLSGCAPHHVSQSQTTNSNQPTNLPPPKPDLRFYADQLARVRRLKFQKKKIMDRGKQRLFWELVDFCRINDYRVFAKVSLGEILSHTDDSAFAEINAKRCAFCLTDKDFSPIAIVEEFRSGELSHEAIRRNNIKQLACESAMVMYIPIVPDDFKDIYSVMAKFLVAKEKHGY